MPSYQQLSEFFSKYIPKHLLYKYGMNFSPMYRRTTGKITHISPDFQLIKVKIPLSWKNRNFVNVMFGGSMFSAVDPFPMVQLLNLIGNEYVVWDKGAEIKFRRPGKETLYAEFTYSEKELEEIRQSVAANKEIEFRKSTLITNKNGDKVFCEVIKNLYIAEKEFYKQKRRAKRPASKS